MMVGYPPLDGMTSEAMKTLVATRMACPEWPDCVDDEGPCRACAEAAAVIATLKRGERVAATIRDFADQVDRALDEDRRMVVAGNLVLPTEIAPVIGFLVTTLERP